MSTSSRFTDLVGCALPIQLAPMGGVGTIELAAAVIAAGGMGMVPHRVEPAAGACGVNFLVPFNPTLDAVAEAAATCAGEYPAGTYDAEGLPAPCIGKLARIDAASRAEWTERSAALEVPADVEAILAECRLLQDRTYERYVIWMTIPGE